MPPGPSQTDQTATRRAVANLRRKGLILLAEEPLRLEEREDQEGLLAFLERKRARLRLAWRTPFGQEIVERYRQELEANKPMRWLMHLDEACHAALVQCPYR